MIHLCRISRICTRLTVDAMKLQRESGQGSESFCLLAKGVMADWALGMPCSV